MDGEAVDEDWVTFLCGRLAEALKEDEDARGLWVMKPGIVAAHDVVQKYIDVRHLVGMERGDKWVWIRD